MSTVGIVVNPWAGKDVRRLHAPVGHTPDAAKIGIVRRIAIGALEAGASRVVVARDVGRIAERATDGVTGASLVDGPGTGSALDTHRAAGQLAELGCGAIAVLGGDGTCRDVAIGWPDAVMIPVSTGTNNVFPFFVDGSSAGLAAGLVATGVVDRELVARRSKLLTIEVEGLDRVLPVHDVALVDVALLEETHVGARAVVRPERIRCVVAAIAHPASTGLSALAGRIRPADRDQPTATVVHLGGCDRRVRVPIVPGVFHELPIASVDDLVVGGQIELPGPGVLAYDGERHQVLGPDDVATIRLRLDGPYVIDADRALRRAVAVGWFVSGPASSDDAGDAATPDDVAADRHLVGGMTGRNPEGKHGN